MPVSDRERRPRAAAGPRRSARPCPGCGYDLRAAGTDARCPECGLPVRIDQRVDDPFSEAETPVIRRFRFGCWLATLSVLTALFTIACATLVKTLDGRVRVSVLLAAAVGWVIAAWMITPVLHSAPGVARGFSDRGRLRLVARWAQLTWLAVAGAHFAIVIGGTALKAPWPDRLGLLAMLLGGLGVVAVALLAVLLERLADWVCDREAAAAFNVTVWGAPVATLALYAWGAPNVTIYNMYSPLTALTAVLFSLWGLTMLAFPFAMLSLSRSVEWSVRHAVDAQERQRRMHERRAEYDREVARSIERMDAARTARRERT